MSTPKHAALPPATFLSDNASPAHPAVLDAVRRANEGSTPAYGADPWTAAAEERLRGVFGSRAVVRFTFGGTGANLLALRCISDRLGAVVCSDGSHLANDEAGGPEQVAGCKLVTVAHDHGRLAPDAVAAHLPEPAGPHRALARALSITQPTELGTLYRPSHLDALAQLARDRDLSVHVDGARLGLAAAALDQDLGETAGDAAVVTLGGTKLGLLGAEAVVFRDPDQAARAATHQKQIGQLASKQRFLAAQFLAWLDGDLWRTLAAAAIDAARRLAEVVDAHPHLDLAYPVETNAVFARVEPERLDAVLARTPGVVWSRRQGLVRWMTGWNTKGDDVEAFAAALPR